jgi:hypothetical protein
MGYEQKDSLPVSIRGAGLRVCVGANRFEMVTVRESGSCLASAPRQQADVHD